jgi:hypothetical protein
LMALHDKPIEPYDLEEASADGAAEPVALRLTNTLEGWGPA